MTVSMILLPLFVEVALTFVLLFTPGMRERTTADPDAAPGRRSAFHSQFELPVLFYVLTALALFTRKADLVFVILAWAFVLSRILHTAVHATSNDTRLRFPLYAVGAVVLALMWVLFALAILLNI